jgi:hypothetical protein
VQRARGESSENLKNNRSETATKEESTATAVQPQEAGCEAIADVGASESSTNPSFALDMEKEVRRRDDVSLSVGLISFPFSVSWFSEKFTC